MQTFPDIKLVPTDDIEKYPKQAFNGKIHVIDNQEKMEHAIAYLRNCEYLGFDTETRPSFKKGLLYPLSLLQLSDEHNAFLFRLQKTGISNELTHVLSSKKILKVGVAIHDDIAALKKIRKFNSDNFVDLQNIAKQLEIENLGLKKLTPLVLGFRISKRQQLSNWDLDSLNEAQLSYAATDAWVSLKIYQTLLPYLHDSTISKTE